MLIDCKHSWLFEGARDLLACWPADIPSLKPVQCAHRKHKCLSSIPWMPAPPTLAPMHLPSNSRSRISSDPRPSTVQGSSAVSAELMSEASILRPPPLLLCSSVTYHGATRCITRFSTTTHDSPTTRQPLANDDPPKYSPPETHHDASHH